MSKLNRVTEGEFSRNLQSKMYTKIIAKESDIVGQEDKYHVLGVVRLGNSNIVYAMRQGRNQNLRT